jgi:hypothetical protein
VLPWSAAVLGFVRLPPALWAALLGLVLAYAAATEAMKHRFFGARTVPGAVAPATP